MTTKDRLMDGQIDRGRERLKHFLGKKTDGWIDRQTEVKKDLKVSCTKRQMDELTDRQR